MKRIITKKTLLTSSLVLVLAAATIVILLAQNNNTSENATSSASPNYANYNPGVAEQQEAERHKAELVRRQHDQGQPTQNGKKQVSVVITSTDTDSSVLNVTGYVQGVIEDGGECTATLTRRDDSKTVTISAFADATTTNCPPIPVQLSSGEWQLALNYVSASSAGSASKKIKVQ